MKSRRINIIYADNGSGLSRDAAVVKEAVTLAGHRAWMTPLAPRKYPLSLNYAPTPGDAYAQRCLRATMPTRARVTARLCNLCLSSITASDGRGAG